MKHNSKKKNPLYVVTDEGNVVQQAKNRIEAFILKWGIGPVLKMVEDLWLMVLEQIKTTNSFQVAHAWIGQFEVIIEKIAQLTQGTILSRSN